MSYPWRLLWLSVVGAGLLLGHGPEEFNRRGAALFEKQRPAEAAAEFARSLELNPRQPAIVKLLGLCYQLTGDHEKAETAFRRAVELNPSDADAWFFLGRHYYQRNFFEKAREALEKSRGLRRGDSRVLTFLGLTLEASGDTAAAERAYQQAIRWNDKLDPPGFRPHYCYGVLLGKLGRLAESAQHLRRAVELEPNRWEAWFELAKTLYRQRRLEPALQALRAALATRTAEPEEAARLYHLLARIYFDMNLPEEAAQALRMRESLAP